MYCASIWLIALVVYSCYLANDPPSLASAKLHKQYSFILKQNCLNYIHRADFMVKCPSLCMSRSYHQAIA